MAPNAPTVTVDVNFDIEDPTPVELFDRIKTLPLDFGDDDQWIYSPDRASSATTPRPSRSPATRKQKRPPQLSIAPPPTPTTPEELFGLTPRTSRFGLEVGGLSSGGRHSLSTPLHSGRSSRGSIRLPRIGTPLLHTPRVAPGTTDSASAQTYLRRKVAEIESTWCEVDTALAVRPPSSTLVRKSSGTAPVRHARAGSRDGFLCATPAEACAPAAVEASPVETVRSRARVGEASSPTPTQSTSKSKAYSAPTRRRTSKIPVLRQRASSVGRPQRPSLEDELLLHDEDYDSRQYNFAATAKEHRSSGRKERPPGGARKILEPLAHTIGTTTATRRAASRRLGDGENQPGGNGLVTPPGGGTYHHGSMLGSSPFKEMGGSVGLLTKIPVPRFRRGSGPVDPAILHDGATVLQA